MLRYQQFLIARKMTDLMQTATSAHPVGRQILLRLKTDGPGRFGRLTTRAAILPLQGRKLAPGVGGLLTAHASITH
jgi:hypothetical protein